MGEDVGEVTWDEVEGVKKVGVLGDVVGLRSVQGTRRRGISRGWS